MNWNIHLHFHSKEHNIIPVKSVAASVDISARQLHVDVDKKSIQSNTVAIC